MENLDDMNKRDNEIRQILQSPLGEGDHVWAEPGDQVWAGIEAALPERKKRGGFWWWFGGGLTLLLLAFFLTPNGTDLVSQAVREANTPKNLSTEHLGNPNPILLSEEEGSVSVEIINPQDHTPVKPEGIMPLTNQTETTHTPSENAIHQDAENTLNAISFPDELNLIVPEVLKNQRKPVEINGQENSELRADQSLSIPLAPTWVSPQIPRKFEEVACLDQIRLPIIERLNPSLASGSDQVNILNKSQHRILIYGQGIYANRRIERKSPVNIFDPEFGHKNTQFRFGAGYEFQHHSGLFAGSGIEYQEFHELVDKEKKWIYTKKNATQVGSDLFQQNIPVVINSGFGTASTTLRVDIEENSLPTNYQEGDPVIFKMTVDHSLNYIRIPFYLGYQYEWRRWFAEIRGGTGLQIYIGSKSQVTQVTESKGKIKIRESASVNQLKHVRPTLWDLQGGIYAGYKLSDAWGISCGYEYWQSLQSVVDRPNMSTFTSGSGIQVALRRTF